MKKIPREHRPVESGKGRGRGFYYSLLLHAAIVLVFVVGLDWTTSQPAPTPPGDSKIMNATAVDSKAVAQEIKKLKTADQAKQQEADRKVREVEEKRQNEEKALEKIKVEKEQVKQEKEAENRRLEQEKQRLQQEKEQVTREKEQIEQKVAEKKKLEEQRKLEDQKKAEQQKKVDEKKKQEEDAKKKADDEAKKKTDEAKKKADDKKKAEDDKKKAEAKRKAEEAKALADELAAEEAELASANQGRADQSDLARYAGALTRQVTSNFVAPDISSGLKCTLQVRMIATGEVIDARVVKSSGNATFDRQAELAVRKASPLPVPENPRLLQQITAQGITFEFDPSGIN